MRLLNYAVFIILISTFPALGDPVLPKLRISIENTPTHVQTQAVSAFARDLGQRLQGKLKVMLFANASLYRDRDVIQALVQDKVEMAVPGTWHITQYEPNVGIFLLPVFYGRPARANYRVLESRIGRDLNQRIETGLGLKVIGRWIDLGHAHLFGVNRLLKAPKDLKGMRIRVAGGKANKLRVSGFGARPSVIAWPDLSEHMARNKVDALLTSYETVRSAKLWEKGITSVYEDRAYFPRYIPLIRESFWRRLSPETRTVITETWETHVDRARQMAAQAQIHARETLITHGVHVTVPDEAQLAATRRQLMALQDKIVRETRIDRQMARQVTALLKE